jgi:hypothetical protein
MVAVTKPLPVAEKRLMKPSTDRPPAAATPHSFLQCLAYFLTPQVWKQAQRAVPRRRAWRWQTQPLLFLLLALTWCAGDSLPGRFETARAFYVALHPQDLRRLREGAGQAAHARAACRGHGRPRSPGPGLRPQALGRRVYPAGLRRLAPGLPSVRGAGAAPRPGQEAEEEAEQEGRPGAGRQAPCRGHAAGVGDGGPAPGLRRAVVVAPGRRRRQRARTCAGCWAPCRTAPSWWPTPATSATR